jgi:hypothetical protein
MITKSLASTVAAVSTLAVSFSGLGISLFLDASPAQAGGSDEPIPSTTSRSTTASNEKLSELFLLNWDKWGTPYWLNSSICRESQGNIVCLSPQEAQEIRWEIPYQNQSLNPK